MEGGLEEHVVGVLIHETTIQLLKKTRFGYVPTSLSEDTSDWELISILPEDKYHYVEKNKRVNLVVDNF